MLIHLVLTLIVFTATIEWTFSAMKLVKNILRTRMEDKFPTDHWIRILSDSLELEWILLTAWIPLRDPRPKISHVF
jgi:hypothetical protein